jgi:hypothetical protein
MKNTSSNLKHITGDLAYVIYWMVVYDCSVRLSSVEAIDRNLEIIVNSEGKLLAYRYDHPIEMTDFTTHSGEWNRYNPGNLSTEELMELNALIES